MEARRLHAVAGKRGGDRFGALPRQLFVAHTRSGGVGKAVHVDPRLVVLLEHDGHGADDLFRTRAQGRRIQIEQDVVLHVERDRITAALDRYAGGAQVAAKLFLLAVHVVADAAARRRADAGADQRVRAALVPVGERADRGTAERADT